MKKYSILTYIFNNDEFIREVPKEDNIEYVCVTDNPNLKSDTWKIIVDEDLKGLDPLYASFYVRHHPWKYCSGEVCIRIDGSIRINKSLLPIFEEFDNSSYDVCVMANSRAKSINEELFHWLNIMYKDVKSKQLELYKSLGINTEDYGVIQSPITITRNTDICNKCDALCWDIIDRLSTDKQTMRPSQVALTVALQLTEGLNIMFVDETLIQSDVMQWCRHNSDIIRKSLYITKHSSFFGKPIKIHNFNGVHCNNDIVWREAAERKSLYDIFNSIKQHTSKQDLCDNK